MLAILCLGGCGKQESRLETRGTEILLNPSLPENDATIGKVMENFAKKSFKPLARHLWLDPAKPKFMLLFSRPGNGSHASGAEISGLFAEYDAKTKNWTVTAQAVSFAENGAWGEPPEPRFVKLGPDRYGFTMEPGFLGQGYTKQALFIYGIKGSKFVELLKIPSYADNAGAVFNDADIYTVKVNIYQVIDNGKEFYDLKAKVENTGKYAITPDDEYYETFGKSREVTIVFKNGKYIVEGKSQ